VVLSGANRTDMQKRAEPAGAAPGARALCLDRGYDYAACRQAAAQRGYRTPSPPTHSQEHPLPPPRHPDRHPPRRWVVEVAHSWFNRFRRLLIRWEKRAKNYLAFVHLAACLIVYRKLRHARSLPG
jgi:transposase